MSEMPYLCLALEELPDDPGWLQRQPVPVIAMGEGSTHNADVVTADVGDLTLLRDNIARTPVAAMILVQVLRAVE